MLEVLADVLDHQFQRLGVEIIGGLIEDELDPNQWTIPYGHFSAYGAIEETEVVAVANRGEERLKRFVDRFGITNTYLDYREMIEKARLDALVISVPDDLHYPIASTALDAGLHLLCEKPLALNVDQAEAMLAKAQAAKGVHMILFTYRWSTYHRYLRQLIEENYIGRPYHGHWHFFSDKGRSGQYEWKYDQQRSSGALSLRNVVRWRCVTTRR